MSNLGGGPCEAGAWNTLLNKLFGQKRTIQSPTFVKDFTKKNHQLIALNELFNKVVEEDQKDNIERDIKLLKYGIDGENNVYFVPIDMDFEAKYQLSNDNVW